MADGAPTHEMTFTWPATSWNPTTVAVAVAHASGAYQNTRVELEVSGRTGCLCGGESMSGLAGGRLMGPPGGVPCLSLCFAHTPAGGGKVGAKEGRNWQKRLHIHQEATGRLVPLCLCKHGAAVALPLVDGHAPLPCALLCRPPPAFSTPRLTSVSSAGGQHLEDVRVAQHDHAGQREHRQLCFGPGGGQGCCLCVCICLSAARLTRLCTPSPIGERESLCPRTLCLAAAPFGRCSSRHVPVPLHSHARQLPDRPNPTAGGQRAKGLLP